MRIGRLGAGMIGAPLARNARARNLAAARHPGLIAKPRDAARAAAPRRPVPMADRNRVDGFSDNVFAFAATLLVLGLHDPGGQGGLAREWPSFAAYTVSFATIGIIWINHNTLFGHLGRLDRPLVFLNLLLLLLLLVAVIPFPAALLASHLRAGGAAARVAAAVYGATMTAMGAVFATIWARVASREHLLAAGTTFPARPGAAAALPGRACRLPRRDRGVGGQRPPPRWPATGWSPSGSACPDGRLPRPPPRHRAMPGEPPCRALSTPARTNR